jgi:hypothetical protein
MNSFSPSSSAFAAVKAALGTPTGVGLTVLSARGTSHLARGGTGTAFLGATAVAKHAPLIPAGIRGVPEPPAHGSAPAVGAGHRRGTKRETSPSRPRPASYLRRQKLRRQ